MFATVPAYQGIWIPADIEHSIAMLGPVSTRGVYLESDTAVGMPTHCQVLGISPLLRELLIEAVDLPSECDTTGRAGMIMSLAIEEVRVAPEPPLRRACLVSALPRLLCGERVTTLAFDLGYSSPAAFTTMFKQVMGTAPQNCRCASHGVRDRDNDRRVRRSG